MKQKNYQNKKRHVGFELEFHGVMPALAAELTAEVVKGKVERKNDVNYQITSRYGTFKTETDAHIIKKLAEVSEENLRAEKFDFEGLAQKFITLLTEDFVPTEIVTPPMVISDDTFDVIRRIETKLKEAGAKGTNESIRYAFAAQLNPELQSTDAGYLLDTLRAFILLTDWLREQIHIDLSRQLTSFIDDFPLVYAELILDPGYNPGLEQFMDDYIRYNPTRNRGLDYMPLFAFLDPEKIETQIGDDRIKARPTFHYRLPSCQFSLKSWSILIEWKRWLLIEKLAADKELLKEMSENWLQFYDEGEMSLAYHWLLECRHYTERLR